MQQCKQWFIIINPPTLSSHMMEERHAQRQCKQIEQLCAWGPQERVGPWQHGQGAELSPIALLNLPT